MSEGLVNYEADWRAVKIPSNMTFKKLAELRARYCIPHYIDLLLPKPHECACFPRKGCVAVNEFLF